MERSSRAGQRDWEDFNRRAHHNDNELQLCRSRIEHAQQTVQSLQDRLSKLDAEPQAPVDAGLGELAAKVQAAKGEVERIKAAIAANDAALAALRQRVAAAETAVAKGQRERRKRYAASWRPLPPVQEAALGRKQSPGSAAERWIDANGLRDAPRLGQQLTVEPGWNVLSRTRTRRRSAGDRHAERRNPCGYARRSRQRGA